ncbi:predicted protein [Uncinocarpus reesii 1704]|uniref:Uncharacterized protein n=1 Tax=Uncinocarpus reesii (strain UAMH 1704) TaxID=336963 RepID=C4JV26_UNCRE|nr:uncharacterized protein UREG_04979 [Uncinocarpus reesii 1704]EEP80137.1 predicted protein [Uncinocarpus reesii 1704]
MHPYHIPAPTPAEFHAAAFGKVVIITGAAQGIGFAIAERFAISGAKAVIIADLDPNLGIAAKERIEHGAVFIGCDVSSWTDQVQLFRETIKRFGHVDLVVCNAGINPELMVGGECDYLVELEDGDEEYLRPQTKVFDVNLTGVVYSVRLAMHHLSRDGGGRIVVIDSAASYIPVPDQALYSASKHGILGLVRSTSKRRECSKHRISISMVAPWLTETRVTSGIFQEAISKAIPVSSPRDVASAVSTVVTQPLEKINGKSLWVQGQLSTKSIPEWALRTGSYREILALCGSRQAWSRTSKLIADEEAVWESLATLFYRACRARTYAGVGS